MTILKSFKTTSFVMQAPITSTANHTRTYVLNPVNNRLLIESPNQDFLYINNNAYDYLTFVNDWEAEPTVINNFKTISDASKNWFSSPKGVDSSDNYHWPYYHSLQQSLLMTTRLSMSKNLNPITSAIAGIASYSPSPTNMEGYYYSLDKATYYKNAIISKQFLNSNDCLLIDCTLPNIVNNNGGFKATNFLFVKGNELYNNANTSSIGKTANTLPDAFNSYIPVAYNESLKKIYCLFEAYTSSATLSSTSILSTSQIKVFNYDFLVDETVSLSLQTSTNWGVAGLNQAYIGTAGQKDYSLAYNSGTAVQAAFSKVVATAAGTNHSAYMGKDNSGSVYFLSTFNNMRTTWNVAVTPTDFNLSIFSIKYDGSTTVQVLNTDTYRASPNHRINRTGWYDAKAGSCLTYCNIASKFENSPLTDESNIYYSYIPAYADLATTFSATCSPTTTYFTPILVKWNKANDPFSAQVAATIKDCNISYPTDKTWFDYGNVYNTTTANNVPINSSQVKRNSQCFITKLNDVYYLNHIQCLGYKGSYDFGSNNNLKYRIVTYTIGSTSWENLTFHSSSQLDSDVLSFLPIDETWFTKIMCLHDQSICFYSFNPSAGWTLTYKEIGSFRQVTRDQLNRVWAYSVTNDDILDSDKSSMAAIANQYAAGADITGSFEVKLHLISESLSNVVSVRFEDNTQTYNGVDINSNVYVSVFDETGTRIAANVQLVLEGTNTVFVLADNSTSYTKNVTSLQASDLAVPIKIKGAGYANVYANVIF